MRRFQASAVIAALLVLLAGETPVGEAATLQPGLPLAVVSEDPYMNETSYHRTEVEPDTFAFGSTIVATFQAGRFQGRGASNLGWSVSTNAGPTWNDGFLPSITIRADPPGPWRRVTDLIAYDAKHDVWMIFGLESPFHRTVFVSRSTDGARTFDAPVIVRTSERGRHDFDKTWITCDNSPTSPYYGHVESAGTGALTNPRRVTSDAFGDAFANPPPDPARRRHADRCSTNFSDSSANADGSTP